MMVDNYFRSDHFCVAPCKGCVRVVGQLGEAFEQVARFIRRAGEAPEVGWALEGDADHVAVGVVDRLGACVDR